MILLDKMLSSFAYPLGLALVGFLLSALAVGVGARRRGMAAMLAIAALLWAASTPIVADGLSASLEHQYPALAIENNPAADVIIVLGGGPDRVYHGLRLFKAGKAPKILLSGGTAFASPGVVSEADAMAEALVSFGVDPAAIILETKSRNTYENAALSKEIWRRERFKSGLLVTSALHVPRALATFHKAGMMVKPAATDAVSGREPLPLFLRMLPSSASLDVTTRALKEWLGLYVYGMRDYV